MSATQQQVRMVDKLYECRDTAKRLFGDGYKARMDAYGQVIKSMVKTTDMNELESAMYAAKESGGIAAVCYLAAFVEMTDQESNECQLPPLGWRCTRSEGHEGPCAAVEAPEDAALVASAMQRLREA